MLDEGRDKDVRNYNSTNFRLLQGVSRERKKLKSRWRGENMQSGGKDI